MHYRIELGIPEFSTFFIDLITRARTGKLDKDEIRLFKKLSKIVPD